LGVDEQFFTCSALGGDRSGFNPKAIAYTAKLETFKQ